MATQTLNMNHNFINYQCAANTLFHQIIKVFPIIKSREEFLEVCLALNERFFFSHRSKSTSPENILRHKVCVTDLQWKNLSQSNNLLS